MTFRSKPWLVGLAAAGLGLLTGARLPATEPRTAWPLASFLDEERPAALAWDACTQRLVAAQPGAAQVSWIAPQGVVPLFTNEARARHADASPDGTPAAETRLGAPREVLATPDGAVCFACSYFQDTPGQLRRYYLLLQELRPPGTFHTLAGTHAPGPEVGLEPVSAHEARFELPPPQLALDSEGGLLLGALTVIRVLKDGMIRPIAGTGVFGHTGDGGPALSAKFAIDNLAVGPDGSIFVVEPTLSKGTCVRKLTRQADGHYTVRTIDELPKQDDPLRAFGRVPRNAITVDPEGRVFVLTASGARIDQLTPTSQGYVRTPVPQPRAVVDGRPVLLFNLIAAGDDSLFALNEARDTILFLGPERESPRVRQELASMAALLETAPTQPQSQSQSSQDAEAQAPEPALAPQITDHLRRIGRLLRAEGGPNLVSLLAHREAHGRPLTAQAQLALARRTYRRALLKALLPKLGVPQAYLASHDVDALLAGAHDPPTL